MDDQEPDASWEGFTPHDAAGVELQTSQWVEHISEAGETYYLNVVTGETSWTHPEGEQVAQEWVDSVEAATPDDAEAHPVEDVNAIGAHGLEAEEVDAVDYSIAESSSELGPAIQQPLDADQEYIDEENDTSELVADAFDTGRLAPDLSTDPASPIFSERGSTPASGAQDAVEWLELSDPEQSALYYFSPQTGEIRWEKPSESTARVRPCDSDAVLSTVVSLQSAARSQQAQARVTLMREEKLKQQLEDPQQTDSEINDANSGLGEQWVEVYDPSTQQQYYYSPRTNATRWDAPEEVSSDDRKVAAATAIQSLSRGRVARKQVTQLRSQQQSDQDPVRPREEGELEALRRREMVQEELSQLASGDRFWGLDAYESDVLRLRIDEELLAKGVAVVDQASDSLMSSFQHDVDKANLQLEHFLALEEEAERMNTERLQRELQSEFDAREAMHQEERQQCQNGDSFWGIQAEEARQRLANVAMALEEAASRQFADDVLKEALNVAWEAEVQSSVENDLASRGGVEQRMQARYFRWFYGQCASVDELLNYRWPTKQQQSRLEEAASPVKRRPPVVHVPRSFLASATPYPLDDLVVRERLEHGDLRYGLRSLLTVHHEHPRGTNGTHFEITMAAPECAFDKATAAALLKHSSLASSLDERVEGSIENDEHRDDRSDHTKDVSSINYRRSKTPDPHIPARFNGVPYKPNQLSPTREILSGDHRKLNQLPALAKMKLGKQETKPRQLQKAKARDRGRAKAADAVVPPSVTNGNDSVSGREGDAPDVVSPSVLDSGPHAQFVRHEYEVLSRLFSLMDVDGSGTVNQDEMRWALQRDEEINALAKTSPLLRLLLKQRTRLESLFSLQDEHSELMDKNELSLNEFLARCERCHLQLMTEGLIQPDSVSIAPPSASEGNARQDNLTSHNSFLQDMSDDSDGEAEARTIRRVFALLDIDQNGVLDVAEVRRALYDSAATPTASTRSASTGVLSKELHTLVKKSKALQPMLHQELFMTAFSKFEPSDPRGINEEEFVAFCLEIAQVAAVNNMIAV